jgi:DNA repair protein RecO (recombination protein O)
MALQGYLPAFDRCAECGKVLSGEQAFLSAEAGGILCASCKNNKSVRSLIPGSLALMKQLTKVDLEKLDRLRWNIKTKEEILENLRLFSEERFERKLQAWRQGKQLWGK